MIEANYILRPSKKNNGSSREIQMVITFHLEVRFSRIIYRDNGNWTRKLSPNSNGLNRTSVWIVLTIWISAELPLFNFERLDIWCAWIGLPSFSYDHFNFSRASVVQFRASRYIMRLNRTSEWKFMTIWNSRDHPLFNNQRLDILWAWIGHPSE